MRLASRERTGGGLRLLSVQGLLVRLLLLLLLLLRRGHRICALVQLDFLVLCFALRLPALHTSFESALRITEAGRTLTFWNQIWTRRADMPICLPTSSRISVVGKRVWASKALSTAAWCGVVSVRLRFLTILPARLSVRPGPSVSPSTGKVPILGDVDDELSRPLPLPRCADEPAVISPSSSSSSSRSSSSSSSEPSVSSSSVETLLGSRDDVMVDGLAPMVETLDDSACIKVLSEAPDEPSVPNDSRLDKVGSGVDIMGVALPLGRFGGPGKTFEMNALLGLLLACGVAAGTWADEARNELDDEDGVEATAAAACSSTNAGDE